MKRIVVAPDSFKGSLTSSEICSIIKEEIIREIPLAQVNTIPMADGGEGACKALIDATSGKKITVQVQNPLGEMFETYYGVLGDGETVVIEVATIIGYTLVTAQQRNILELTTIGVGQCILHALDQGYRKIIIGIGGSATNDGGIGMLQALGVTFYNKYNTKLPHDMSALFDVEQVDFKTMDERIYATDIRVASDVSNPLCGDQGTSYIFGFQKGATLEQVNYLDEKLNRFSQIVENHIDRSIKNVPGAGAAGGLGFALLSINGKIENGASIISELTNLNDKLKHADLVITGEGKTDLQTLMGKLPLFVASKAKEFNLKTIVISGEVDILHLKELNKEFHSLHSIVNGPISLEDSMKHAEVLLRSSVKNIVRLL